MEMTAQHHKFQLDLFDDNMENIVDTYRILIKSIDDTYRIGSVKWYRALHSICFNKDCKCMCGGHLSI